MVAYHADEVRLQVDAACAGLLVLSDTYFPGWTATVDGKASEIYPTDITFRGVAVPAGRSEVVFRYRPTTFRNGIVVAAGAVVVMSGAGVFFALRRRRARRVPSRARRRSSSIVTACSPNTSATVTGSARRGAWTSCA